jgi:hypothetical protein
MVLASQLLDLVKTLEISVLDFALGNLSAVGIVMQSFYLIVVTVIAILVLILIIADIDTSINRRIIKIVAKILTAFFGVTHALMVLRISLSPSPGLFYKN